MKAIKDTKMKVNRIRQTLLILTLTLIAAIAAVAQTTDFTYQGTLEDNGSPANGTYDFEFRLFDDASAGTQIGSPSIANAVTVANGSFSVALNFGNQFPSALRWLEIRVRQAAPAGTTAELGGYTILTPRQRIRSVPYAVRSIAASSAATATNALQLGGVAANQYVVTTDPRLSDSRTPTAGSADYIQNGTTQQTSSNFNISGTGKAGVFSAASQFNIGDSRVLSTAGTENTFVGIGTAAANIGGHGNSFFGRSAGAGNTSGFGNSFFGLNAGMGNVAGIGNSYFGAAAGLNFASGDGNTFVGQLAGIGTPSGSYLTAVGWNSGFGASGLSYATAIGASAVVSTSNTVQLGRVDGSDTVFIPGNLNLTGSFTGSLPAGSPNYIQNSTSLQSSSNFNISGKGEASIFDADTEFRLDRERILDGDQLKSNLAVGMFAGSPNFAKTQLNTYVGFAAGANPGGEKNTYLGAYAGYLELGAGNVAIGWNAGPIDFSLGSNNMALGTASRYSENLFFATAIGAGSNVTTNDTIVLGREGGLDRVIVPGRVSIGSATNNYGFLNINAPNSNGNIFISGDGQTKGVNFGVDSTTGADAKLFISQYDGTTFKDRMVMNEFGVFSIAILGVAGSTQMCRNASNQFASCSSSIRYKNNVEDFSSGLDILRRLRPVTFNWKDSGTLDLGLVAEEVAKIEPLLATYRDGVVEGVKYDRIGVVLVNVVKEQQKTIEVQGSKLKVQSEDLKRQADELEAVKTELAALKALVCTDRPDSAVCKVEDN